MGSAGIEISTPRYEAAQRQQRELLALGLGLAVLLAGVKAVLLPFPVSTPTELLRWVLRWAIVAASDVAFAAVLTAFWLVARRAVWRWPALLLFVRWAWRGAFVLAATYGVASVAIFRALRAPLRITHLWLAGSPDALQSSVAACVSPASLAVLAAGPLLVCGALWWQPKFVRRLAAAGRARHLMAVLTAVAACTAVCRGYVHARWTDPNRWERRIAANPHWVFLQSCVEQWLSPGGLWTALDGLDECADPPAARRPCAAVVLPPDVRPPRHVLLVLLESVSAEYLSLYGARYDTTPHLARIAATDGVVFDNAYVTSPCSCNTLATLALGIHPRLDATLLVRDAPHVPVPSLPEILRDAGFRTCFAHAGAWSWKQRDRFLRLRGAETLIDAESLGAPRVTSWGIADRRMFQAVLDWIDRSDGRPFFALAYTIETHHPYVAGEAPRDFGVGDPHQQRYLNAVRGADELIGWLYAELQRRGLADETLLVVTSDHGESFGQHNQRVHSFSVYDHAVRVPLVLIHPALRTCPRRVAAVRSHVDLPPTIVQLLGIEPPPQWQGSHLLRHVLPAATAQHTSHGGVAPAQGSTVPEGGQRSPAEGDAVPSGGDGPLAPRDSAPGGRGGPRGGRSGPSHGSSEAPDDEAAFFVASGNEVILGVRLGDYKYHYYVESRYEELFDVAHDPHETANLAPARGELCRRLRGCLAGFVRQQLELQRASTRSSASGP
jgi:lipoteichoic acid synthase